jgi:hypothetical protein
VTEHNDGEPFDPLARALRRPGEAKLAVDLRNDRIEARERAQQLAAHLGLGPTGKRKDAVKAVGLRSHKNRIERDAKFYDFPPIPDDDLMILERLIARYGLPLMDLAPETANFVLNRVLADYNSLQGLRHRAVRKPLFSPEELLELMRVLEVNQFSLARLVDANSMRRGGTLATMISRWLHGINLPTSGRAVQINAMIEQFVRKRRPLTPEQESHLQASRRWKARQKKNYWEQMPDLPVASGAEDATEELYGRNARRKRDDA